MRTILLAGALLAMNTFAADTDAATDAINRLGLDLHRRLAKADENLCLSPYSIQNALAMTFAGADGETRDEMAKALHFPKDDKIHESVAALNKALVSVTEKTTKLAADAKKHGGPSDPIVMNVANRLFGQNGYEFRAPFLALVNDRYGAPMELLDFKKDPEAARKHINDWVEDQTRNRIRDIIQRGDIRNDTKLALVNAVYLKAPWQSEFYAGATKPEPFHVQGRDPKNLPTMVKQHHFGFAKREGYRAVTIPYTGGEVHFLVLVPDEVNGLPAVEKAMTAETLADLSKVPHTDVILHLPKFKIEPPSVELGGELMNLGMKSAFDQPAGSANFDRMAPRKPNDYLCISKVIHKTFLELDEKGTEAAAATVVLAVPGAAARAEPPKPVEVKVDRPFLFAIQHAPSGACLFLGRMSDPTGK